MKNAAVQSEYARIQEAQPSMLNLKHMISRDTFFVYGKILTAQDNYAMPVLSIAAFSDRFQQHELVDMMPHLTPGAQYGLNLPAGKYELVVFADKNGNGIYDADEVVGQQTLDLTDGDSVSQIKANVDILIGDAKKLDWPVQLKVVQTAAREQSLFFPPNTIRTLDDPLFDPSMAALGMYHPAAFLEKAGTMFYALEEDVSYKIPVIFVHGINGSAREFDAVLSKLDRTRFKPWFFHYPSGGNLDQMAQFFFNIFLSGNVIPVDENIPIVIVAHSMGGLVIREALNRIGTDYKNRITFISMATPFGGHPSAAAGEKNGLLVLPSWRDLNPGNSFIQNLYRKPLPKPVEHKLMYAFANPDTVKIGENSDGTVPLASQLHKNAQLQASEQIGFNTSHVGILKDADAIEYLIAQINQVKAKYPEKNMSFVMQGGYQQALDSRYSKQQIYLIRYYGKYMRAVVQKQVEPLSEGDKGLLDVAAGKKAATTDIEKAWAKFVADYPQVLAPGFQ